MDHHLFRMQRLIKCLGAVTSYDEKTIPDTIYFPAYSISPEEIFQGRILLFNVDFFGEAKTIKEATKDQVDDEGNVVTDENGNTFITQEEYDNALAEAKQYANYIGDPPQYSGGE